MDGDIEEFGAEWGRANRGHGTHSGSLPLRSFPFLSFVSPFNLQYVLSNNIPQQCK